MPKQRELYCVILCQTTHGTKRAQKDKPKNVSNKAHLMREVKRGRPKKNPNAYSKTPLKMGHQSHATWPNFLGMKWMWRLAKRMCRCCFLFVLSLHNRPKERKQRENARKETPTKSPSKVPQHGHSGNEGLMLGLAWGPHSQNGPFWSPYPV